MRMLISTITFAAVINATAANSATIEVVPGRYENEFYLSISGTIERGDSEIFAYAAWEAIMRNQGNLTIVLNSDGGDVEEAIRIGELTRELLGATRVHGTTMYQPGTPAGDELEELAHEFYHAGYALQPLSTGTYMRDDVVQCVSACVLIFFAGTDRVVWDNSLYGATFETRQVIPSIGIHRPRYDEQSFAKLGASEASSAYNLMEEGVRAYMYRMGAPNDLVDRMFEVPSYEVEFFNAEEFNDFFVPIVPFMEEWTAAKCGSPAMSANLLASEQEAYEHILAERLAALEGGVITTSQWDSYFPSDISPSVGRDILNKVQSVSMDFAGCSNREIRQHQMDWASNFVP